MTAEEIYVVLAFVMLMGIAQKPSLRLYFSQIQLVGRPKFGLELVEGLLVKYSVMRGVSCHHDCENIVKRLAVSFFP